VKIDIYTKYVHVQSFAECFTAVPYVRLYETPQYCV